MGHGRNKDFVVNPNTNLETKGVTVGLQFKFQLFEKDCPIRRYQGDILVINTILVKT